MTSAALSDPPRTSEVPAALPVGLDSRGRFEEAVCALLVRSPWYGELAMRLRWRLIHELPDPDGRLRRTAWVDERGHICFNTWLLDRLEPAFRPGLIKHELLHVVRDHPRRGRMYEGRQRWNIAVDLDVNSWCHLPRPPLSTEDRQLVSRGGQPTEATQRRMRAEHEAGQGFYCWHPEDVGLPVGLWADEYYALLPAHLQLRAPDWGFVVLDHDCEASDTVLSALQRDIDRVLYNMARETHRRGQVPAALKSRVDRLLQEGRVSWQQLLSQYAASCLQGERRHDWKRPDRRYPWVVPGRRRRRKHRVAIGLDTSGSTQDQRELFWAEVQAIREQTGCEMWCFECDCEVADGMPYPFTGQVPETMSGNGGTAFGPLFQHIHETGFELDLLIYFTDGLGEDPPQPDYLDYDVVWVTTQADPASWGHIIRMPR